MSLDDLLEAEVVYAASRRIQSLREAPSAVSVVTAAEIREHGYRTLADVLRSLPSFYVTEDRRYSYVGVRGFNRPGDYGARVLLLLNGLRTNDNLYEQAYVGQEFLLDIDLVERIEVVRGPSAAIYGNSAFFAVVNVVTRHGRDFQGGELSASAASFGTHGGRATYGRRLDERPRVPRLRLPLRQRRPAALLPGVRRARDRATASRTGSTANASSAPWSACPRAPSRSKRATSPATRESPPGPTAPLFGDPRTRATDAKDLVSLTWARALPNRSSVMARVHYGFSDYHGTYALAEPADPAERRLGPRAVVRRRGERRPPPGRAPPRDRGGRVPGQLLPAAAELRRGAAGRLPGLAQRVRAAGPVRPGRDHAVEAAHPPRRAPPGLVRELRLPDEPAAGAHLRRRPAPPR